MKLYFEIDLFCLNEKLKQNKKEIVLNIFWNTDTHFFASCTFFEDWFHIYFLTEHAWTFFTKLCIQNLCLIWSLSHSCDKAKETMLMILIEVDISSESFRDKDCIAYALLIYSEKRRAS